MGGTEVKDSPASPPGQTQIHDQQKRQASDYSDCGGGCLPFDDVVPLIVHPLFEENQSRCALPGPPAPPPNVRQQKQNQQLLHEQQQELQKQQHECLQQMSEEGELAMRWECRMVTPCMGLGLDCLSGEGCGLIFCDRPFSLFSNCCTVELPRPFLINSRNTCTTAHPLGSQPSMSIPGLAAKNEKAKIMTLLSPAEKGLPLPRDEDTCIDTSIKPLKLCVATWNTEYQEFASEYISSLEAQLHARGQTPTKGASTLVNLYESESQSLQYEAAQSTTSSLTIDPDIEMESRQDSSSDASTHTDEPPLIQRHSTLCLSKPGPNQQPLKDWLHPGYDIYVVTLQEVTSRRRLWDTLSPHADDNIFSTIGLYLEVEHGERYLRVNIGDGKISGLGKGAWTKKKATSMINGSKGAVTLVLSIYDQVVCFVGCHMPASGVKERLRARQHIRKKLGQIYGSSIDVDFARVFHHVIWAGDFNFRLQASPEVYMPLLQKLDIKGLLQYDECTEDHCQDMERHRVHIPVVQQLREAPVEFLPTYKKADGRPPLDTSDPDWVLKEYQTQMKKGVLGQKIVERPPSVRIPPFCHLQRKAVPVRSCRTELV
ncbi:endonuclease exonuclease phosphatase domain-containing protein [Cyclospora cayetanensis]|uniref:Endonuclease exonuclease phosphatase domain-containing protein n=1 Tax=Cyclospora cayetanensis TaxID=88456 RepID=A0A1D3CWD5_9EIME|nr:endonuclease exonuclease phosphatase domain-containing protein [Cyclospora cayetanensis]